jgi:hypothetical protein
VKYLELDASTIHGRRYAAALVGSQIFNDSNPYDFLRGIGFNVCHKTLKVNRSFIIDDGAHNDTIKIKLEHIRICPFIAMREGIEVSVVDYDYSEYPPCGVIAGYEMSFFTLLECGKFKQGEPSLSLSLSPIKADKFEGVRIVEVSQ